MRNKGFAAALLAASAMLALPAQAADNGVYFGGSVGYSQLSEDVLDLDATGFKVIGGWRFIDWLAVEANYVDFGAMSDEIDSEELQLDADGYSVSALAFLPVGPVDLFARVGAFMWDASIRTDFDRLSDDGTDLVWGGGVQFRVWSLSIRGEYERYDLDGADIDMFSLGATWTFF